MHGALHGSIWVDSGDTIGRQWAIILASFVIHAGLLLLFVSRGLDRC